MGSPCNRDQTLEDDAPAPEVDAAPPLHRLRASHLLLPPPLAHPLLHPPLPQLPLLDGRLCPPDRLVPRSPPGVRHPLQPLQALASSKQVWVESLEEHCPGY